MEEDLLARDTGFNFPQPTVVTCAIFRTSRNLSINTTGATGSSNQNLVSYNNRDTQLPEQLSYLVSYNNRDTQLPEQLSPISAPALPRPCVCTNQ